MSDHDSLPAEPLFRSSKRRRIFRRRSNDNTESLPLVRSTADAEPQEQSSTGVIGQGVAQLTLQRRQATRKHGIAFTGSNMSQRRDTDESERMALTTMHPSRQQSDEQQIDRFVKPTGKAAVADDRHMTAFVESKMAEMRSAASTSALQLDTSMMEESGATPLYEGQINEYPAVGDKPNGTGTSKTIPLLNPATTGNRPRTRTRRSAPARHSSDVARDSLVDQIMNEAAVPIYDRSTLVTSHYAKDGVDNDAAVAAAFRAELAADLETRKRRKPVGPPVKPKGVAPTSHGPKLGGSRAQRERMKAAREEAKKK